MTIPANELQEGDEIAYGVGGTNSKYGAIPIDHVTVVPGSGVLLQYTLPTGAFAESNAKNRIAVSWQGSTPLIQISQDLGLYDSVMVRRK